MKKTITFLIAGLVFTTLAVAESPKPSEKEAIESATVWLTLVDQGEYEKSWQEASTLFQKSVTVEQWAQAVSNARDTLGKVNKRKFSSSEEHTSLPGVPDGRYIILFFDSVFEKKSKGLETVTTMLDSDGSWRVAGYFVR